MAKVPGAIDRPQNLLHMSLGLNKQVYMQITRQREQSADFVLQYTGKLIQSTELREGQKLFECFCERS